MVQKLIRASLAAGERSEAEPIRWITDDSQSIIDEVTLGGQSFWYGQLWREVDWL